jgi:hypothetical protein
MVSLREVIEHVGEGHLLTMDPGSTDVTEDVLQWHEGKG